MRHAIFACAERLLGRITLFIFFQDDLFTENSRTFERLAVLIANSESLFRRSLQRYLEIVKKWTYNHYLDVDLFVF